MLSLIAPLFGVMRYLNRQLAHSDETIKRVAAHDSACSVSAPCPASGPVTAAPFVATIDDVQRFHHEHQLAAYLGLVPREFNSGDGQHRGAVIMPAAGS